MTITVAIRREDKSRWERRTPLLPGDLAEMQRIHGLHFLVQPSPIRAFGDDEYRQEGIELREDLTDASLVVAIKEIPAELLQPGKVYLYFAHVIKGQPQNMPMLRRLLDLGCTLIDYERIVDDKGRRLIFFGVHAGYAGMIETLWCLGRRLQSRRVPTPLAKLHHAYEYPDLAAAKDHLCEIGEEMARMSRSNEHRPLVVGVAGYGNVSRGCQEILACLPVVEVPVAELVKAAEAFGSQAPPLVKVVFKEEDMVVPALPEAGFSLQDYYQHPERYQGCFERHLPYLDVLVNAIYWDERYPRLVTREWTRRSYTSDNKARLQVIGDISCDLEGAIELTVKTMYPDAPCYVYDPATEAVQDGCDGDGPAVMAVDILPSELPREASSYFSERLQEIVATLAAADWRTNFASLDLPAHLKRAVIVHRGVLTPEYRYLEEHLSS